MKILSIVGTAAMFLVGGGILVHDIPLLHHWQEAIAHSTSGVGALLLDLVDVGVVGLILGALVVLLVEGGKRLYRKDAPAHG